MTAPTAEQLEIRALAREFAEGEIRPHTARWDEARALDDELFAKLGELGFLGMLVPDAWGGLDLDVPSYLLVLEELAWGDASVALSVGVQNGLVAAFLARHGSEEQKEAWLPRLATGDALGAFALSEPDSGSDAASLGTRAVREADGWVLNGTKRWVTNGARAAVVLVFARTDGGPGRGSISAFLVEPSLPGYHVGGRELTMGFRASQTVGVELRDVRVPAGAVVGEVGHGLESALATLDLARLGMAAQATGVARAAFEHATAYARERRQFDRTLSEFGAVQEKLATMATRIAGARALTHAVGWRFGAARGGGAVAGAPGFDGASLGAAAAMAKLTASETAAWVTDEAVQIFGGYGYMRDYPVEKLMRDAKGAEIMEGTSEILRVVIARDVLRRGPDVGR